MSCARIRVSVGSSQRLSRRRTGIVRGVVYERERTVSANAGGSEVPLLVRAARGEEVERPPCWMMRQAGRYMASYRELAKQHPSFRVRSETADLAVATTLQPFEAFQPDGVILFSDILTPLPAMGIPFEIDDLKGPILNAPVRSTADLAGLHALDLDYLGFVDEALRTLKREVEGKAALLGFVGAPWTLATYVIEGGSSRLYQKIKGMTHANPELLHALLTALADAVAEYIGFQIDAGADCVQIFDSWGGQLPPTHWDRWSRPYIESMVKQVKAKYPDVPLALYVNGSGGLIDRMGGTGVDILGLDWTVDIKDARERVPGIAVQGNVDPTMLFTSAEAIEKTVKETIVRAGPKGHILNLGHGVLVGTPEENVKHFFDTARAFRY